MTRAAQLGELLRVLDRITNPYYGHEPSGHCALFAIAEEKIAAAGGAEIAHENIFGAEARVEELCAVRFFQIEQDVFRRRLMAGGHHVQPLERVGLVAGAEFIEPFRGVREL